MVGAIFAFHWLACLYGSAFLFTLQDLEARGALDLYLSSLRMVSLPLYGLGDSLSGRSSARTDPGTSIFSLIVGGTGVLFLAVMTSNVLNISMLHKSAYTRFQQKVSMVKEEMDMFALPLELKHRINSY